MTSQDGKLTKILVCDQCGFRFVAPLSRRRALCQECAWGNLQKSIKQMRAKTGPYYDKWLLGMERHRKLKAGE